MNHLVGYLAIVLNLISFAMNNVLYLRLISLLANGIYVIYGILLKSPPLIIGCGMAMLIHLYQIIKLIKAVK